ncbi:MAG TPA: DUF488 domain-containing protein [Candidatus Eisenbacteria bacterium]|nr:DUF488 domain-containing protein [Candidatus Eisenbacteria bacterium]
MVALCYIDGVVTVYTLGHSTLSIEAFVALLHEHRIRGLVDIRRFPASRRHPHFSREALEAALGRERVRYDWIEALGGRRPSRPDSPHVAWEVEAFRGYADHMETPEFASGIATLLRIAGERPTTVMCAEAVPWRCHRRLLGDALVVRGVEVVNVGPGMREPHRLTPFARVDGKRLVYDRGRQGRLPGT